MEKKLFEDVFIGWRIIKNELLEYSEDAFDQGLLSEDMFQAKFKEYTIDSGWYETENGNHFITYLIKDYNWEEPILSFYDINRNEVYKSMKKIKKILEFLK